MLLKNKALLLGTALALLGASTAEAKIHLNPFQHKHKKKAEEAQSPSPEPMDAPGAGPETAPAPPSAEKTSQYDDVGYAVVGEGAGVTAAHASLEVPSFVEITNLDTGRTILAVVRSHAVRGRGLVGLSPQALVLLGAGATGGTPVRVRRVNPPEQEKFALMSGQKAGDRLDTPPMLLAPLKRKLTGIQGQSAANAPLPEAAPVPDRMARPTPRAAARPARSVGVPVSAPPAAAEPAEAVPNGDRFVVEDGGKPSRAAKPALSRQGSSKWTKAGSLAPDEMAPPTSSVPASPSSAYYLQIVSLSNQSSAAAVARKLGGGASVAAAGQYFRVRMGPYATEALARAKLGGLAAKGFGSVKITH